MYQTMANVSLYAFQYKHDHLTAVCVFYQFHPFQVPTDITFYKANAKKFVAEKKKIHSLM